MSENGPVDLSNIDFGPTIRGNQPGDRLFNRFVLKEILGRGGMGIVWLVRDELLDRLAVLKFVPEAVRYDETAVEELKNETRKGLDLAHPNIVKVYDFLIDEKNASISMEYVDGDTISALRIQQAAKVFQHKDLAAWLTQLLSGLEYAHQSAKIVHRDLKPSNLLIQRELQQLKITDFGIARSVADSISRTTIVGNSAGTLSYMSPQQASGAPAQISDDIYSFGSTLFELLTGKPPFFTGDIGGQVRNQPVPSVQARRKEFGLDVAPIPQLWEDLIAACLAKNPSERPHSAGEIANRLELSHSPSLNLKSTVGGSSPPPFPIQKTNAVKEITSTHQVKKSSDNTGKKIALLGAVAVGALTVVGVGGWFAYRHFSKPATTQVRQAKDQSALQDEISHLVKSPNDFPAAREKLAIYLNSFGNDEFYAVNTHVIEAQSSSKETADTGITVPGKFPTIQAAINAANPGDTIHIAAGRYEEAIRLRPRVRLRGSSPDEVIIAVLGSESPTLTAENVDRCWLENLSLIHSGTEDPKDAKHPVVLVRSTIVDMRNCKIERSMGHGIFVTGSTSTPSKFDSVTINRCTQSGMYVERGGKITGAAITSRQNGAHGFSTVHSGSSITLDNCESAENAQSGIIAETNAAIQLTNCRMIGNREAGLALIDHSNAIQVESCKFSKNIKFGIMIQDGSSGKFEKNTIEASEEVGIAIYDAGPETLVSENIISGNTTYGIMLSLHTDPPISIIKNQVNNNGLAGIGITGAEANPTLRENTIEGNLGEGIFIDEGAISVIHDNTSIKNASAGILILGAKTRPNVSGNTVTGNGGIGIHVSEGAEPVIGTNKVADNELKPTTAKPAPTPAPNSTPAPETPKPVEPAPVKPEPVTPAQTNPLPSQKPKIPVLDFGQ